MLRPIATAALALSLAACGPTPWKSDVAPPKDGFQLVTPPLTVAAGEEVLLCSMFQALDEDMTVSNVSVFQAEGGHHAVLIVTTQKYQEGVFRCDGQEGALSMTNWRFVGGGDAAQPDATPLAENQALHIPKGKTLLVQSHYVAGKDGIYAQDTINVTKWTKASTPVIADYWSMGDTGIKVPVGASSNVKTCDVPYDVNVSMLFGHTHQWGVLFDIDLLPQGSEEGMQKLYHETNGPLMRNDPPKKKYPADAPLQVKKGDKVRFTCGWENTTDHALTFPEEMCQAMLLYYPSQGGFLVCDRGGASEIVK